MNHQSLLYPRHKYVTVDMFLREKSSDSRQIWLEPRHNISKRLYVMWCMQSLARALNRRHQLRLGGHYSLADNVGDCSYILGLFLPGVRDNCHCCVAIEFWWLGVRERHSCKREGGRAEGREEGREGRREERREREEERKDKEKSEKDKWGKEGEIKERAVRLAMKYRVGYIQPATANWPQHILAQSMLCTLRCIDLN